MNNKNTLAIKTLLSQLPIHYQDRYLDLVYRHGYLIGMLSELYGKNADVRNLIDVLTKKHQVNRLRRV